MRQLSTCGAVLALAAICYGPAQATDLAPRVAPQRAILSPEPIAYNWTGFYVGVNAGWNWLNTTQTDTGPGVFGQVFPIGSVTTFSKNGFLGGGTIGYNYQMGRFLLGLEADFDWSAAKISQSGTLGALSFNTTVKNNYVFTAGPRIGYVFDRLLVYAKGGIAWTQDDYDQTASDGSEVTGRFDLWGWMVGGGVEYAIWDRLTAKAEYNYITFGDRNVIATDGSILNVGMHISEAKVGINYRFDSGVVYR